MEILIKISEFRWVNNQFLSLDWEISKLQSYDGHIYKFLKIMFHELDNIYMRGLFNFNSIYKYTFWLAHKTSLKH